MSNTPFPASSVSSSSHPQVIPDDDATFASLPIRNIIFPLRNVRPSNARCFLHTFLTDVIDNNVDIPSNLIRPLFGYLNEFNHNVLPILPLPLQVQLQTLFDNPEILSPEDATLFWHNLCQFLISWTPPIPIPSDPSTQPPPGPTTHRRPASNKRHRVTSPSATLPSKRQCPTPPNLASPPTAPTSPGLFARLTSTINQTVTSLRRYFRPAPTTRPVRRNPVRAVRHLNPPPPLTL
jgi:hypothetical protein